MSKARDDPEAELADQETVLPSVDRRRSARLPRARSQRATPRSRRRGSAKPRSPRRSKRRASAGRARTPRSSTRSWPATTSSRRATRWCRPGWRSPWSQLLEEHLPELVDYQFTAQMEDDLDAISRGEQEHVDYLDKFYFGNGTPGLKKQLENKIDEIDARDDQPHPHRQARRAAPTSSSASAATRRSSSRASARRRCPKRLPPDELTLDDGAGAAGAGRSRAKSRWASAPTRTSRCS